MFRYTWGELVRNATSSRRNCMLVLRTTLCVQPSSDVDGNSILLGGVIVLYNEKTE
jgi:hypothetical protein